MRSSRFHVFHYPLPLSPHLSFGLRGRRSSPVCRDAFFRRYWAKYRIEHTKNIWNGSQAGDIILRVPNRQGWCNMTAPLLVSDMVAAVLPFGCENGRLLMLRAYFDDSGTHASAPLVVVGGLIGGPVEWYRFERAWRKLLDLPMEGKPPLRKFSMSKCAAGEDEFSAYSRAERDKITHDFRQVIIASGLVGVASTIDRIAWDELVIGRYREFAGPPEALCLVHVVNDAINYASRHKHGPEIAIVYDAGRETENFSTIGKGFVSGQFGKGQVVSFTFAQVAKFTPLQGADMVATESYWYGTDWLKNGEVTKARPHFQDYLEKVNSWGTILDRRLIQSEIVDRIDNGNLLSLSDSFLWSPHS